MVDNYTSGNTYYVYMLGYNDYVPFYIGKGCKNRKYAHIKEAKAGMDGTKHRVINEFLARGKHICIKIWKDTLSESEAFAYEQLLIKEYAPTRLLTNIVHNKYTFDYHKHQSLMVTVPAFLDYNELGETESEIIWEEIDASVKQAAREAVRTTKHLYRAGISKKNISTKKDLERFAITYGKNTQEAENALKAWEQEEKLRTQHKPSPAGSENAAREKAKAKAERAEAIKNREKAVKEEMETAKEKKRRRREKRRARRQEQEKRSGVEVLASSDDTQP